MSGKSWRDPFLDSFSDTLKSCERDVRRLQRSKGKTWVKLLNHLVKRWHVFTPTWLIHTQGVWIVTRKISPIPIIDDKTYFYTCTCIYLYVYIYIYLNTCICIYNVSIYTSLHATTTILYWITSTPGKSKKKKLWESFLTSPVRSTFSRCQQGKGEDHRKTWSYEPKDFPDHRQGRSFFSSRSNSSCNAESGGNLRLKILMFVQRIFWERKKREIKMTRANASWNKYWKVVICIYIYTYVFICTISKICIYRLYSL